LGEDELTLAGHVDEEADTIAEQKRGTGIIKK